MESDRTRWNAKYQEGRGAPLGAPDGFVVRCLEQDVTVQGRALDLASGTGRHALELARRGWEVEAWDVSEVGLERLSAHAREAGLELGTRRVDLDAVLPAGLERQDLVLVVNYLDRDLLRRLGEAMAPGARLLFATFTTDREGGRPSDRHCLAPGELEAGIPGFRTLVYEETGGRAGWLGVRLEGI